MSTKITTIQTHILTLSKGKERLDSRRLGIQVAGLKPLALCWIDDEEDPGKGKDPWGPVKAFVHPIEGPAFFMALTITGEVR